MKVFALVLLCAFVAVQGRNAGAKNTRALAALGENPWVVHLRIAREATGLLSTCVGSFIDNMWVLTAAQCLSDNRFVWVRYGVTTVLNPSLVTEHTVGHIRLHPEYSVATGANNIAIMTTNRFVHSTDNIAPIALAFNGDLESGKFCGFGEESEAPGELLSCSDVAVASKDDGLFSGSDLEASKFDIGAPLVSDGVQVALLVGAEDGVSTFLPVASYVQWIEGETGLVLSPEAEEEESRSVKFVN